MIETRVDEKALTAIENKFDRLSKESPIEAKKAINKTAKEAKKILATGAKDRYTLKRSNFSEQIKIRSATIGKIEAILSSAGEPLPLNNFKILKGKRATKAQVLKEGSLKELKKSDGDIKAFVNNIAKKNQRRKKDTEKGKAGSEVTHIAVAQREGKERLHIKELKGNSVPKMVEKTYDEKRALVVEKLKRNLDKHIESIMKG